MNILPALVHYLNLHDLGYSWRFESEMPSLRRYHFIEGRPVSNTGLIKFIITQHDNILQLENCGTQSCWVVDIYDQQFQTGLIQRIQNAQ